MSRQITMSNFDADGEIELRYALQFDAGGKAALLRYDAGGQSAIELSPKLALALAEDLKLFARQAKKAPRAKRVKKSVEAQP